MVGSWNQGDTSVRATGAIIAVRDDHTTVNRREFASGVRGATHYALGACGEEQQTGRGVAHPPRERMGARWTVDIPRVQGMSRHTHTHLISSQ